MEISTGRDVPNAAAVHQRLQPVETSPNHTETCGKPADRSSPRGCDAQKGQKTYGRTANGTVFTVPHTEDMVSQLFDPTKPKSASDIAIVVALLCQFMLLYVLPRQARVPVFAIVFLFWRTCYNFGIGWLLHQQSHHNRLVKWARKSGVFDNSESDNPERNDKLHRDNSERDSKPQRDKPARSSSLYQLFKRDFEVQIPHDYSFDEAPVEYNTWLAFRRVVDLILMSDFTAFCLFAFACAGRPLDEKLAMTAARWVGGVTLVLFNLWVKLDAHRVVKDYAWFWGDFFFLIDQELTFDGVFELAPHPMYSIGYVGFYGIAMMAASYKVLFISIIAHAAQLTFLTLVENPHIERTYNSLPPIERSEAPLEPESDATSTEADSHFNNAGPGDGFPPLKSVSKPSPIHNIIGLENLDLHRTTDVTLVLLQVYMYWMTLATPTTWFWQGLFVVHAALWRLWYSVGLGLVLIRQSDRKSWTRHFVKYGESTEEAWRQWKSIYHISTIMCYTSFICAAWKMYGLPADWSYGLAILRHVLGLALIALQVWTARSIFESLGEFGWFFGDFFFDAAPRLTYGGIYRFLNNPEKSIGLAGLWGAAIITWSKAVFFLALLSHILTLCFIQFVERPHMQKRYRESLRRTSGVSKSIQRVLPPRLQTWQGSVDKALDDTLDSIEDFIDAAGPRLAAGFSTFVKDSTTLFKQFPARISISRVSPDLAGLSPKDYSVVLDTSIAGVGASESTPSEREGRPGQVPQVRRDGFRRMVVEYGTPLKVKWTAPLNHSERDWIGLYMVGDNASREVTRIASQGRWIATNARGWDTSRPNQGILVEDLRVAASTRRDGEEQDFLSGVVRFAGDKLWWTQGVFELRYHHDASHNVMAISLPFEIRVTPFPGAVATGDHTEDTDAARLHLATAPPALLRDSVAAALLPVVQNCFDGSTNDDDDKHDHSGSNSSPSREPRWAPRTVSEGFEVAVGRQPQFARRVVYAVREMFGVEFTPAVVAADGSVRNLAWRICNAKAVLAPYSMSRERGSSTPEE